MSVLIPMAKYSIRKHKHLFFPLFIQQHVWWWTVIPTFDVMTSQNLEIKRDTQTMQNLNRGDLTEESVATVENHIKNFVYAASRWWNFDGKALKRLSKRWDENETETKFVKSRQQLLLPIPSSSRLQNPSPPFLWRTRQLFVSAITR